MKHNVNIKLKVMLDDWRHANGRMTQIELAKKMEYSPVYVSKLLSGVYGLTDDFARSVEEVTGLKREKYCE